MSDICVAETMKGYIYNDIFMYEFYPTKRRTVDRMNRFPCELFHLIYRYIDQPLDLSEYLVSVKVGDLPL